MKDKEMPLRKPSPKGLAVSLEDMEKMIVLAVTYGLKYMHFGDFHFELDFGKSSSQPPSLDTPKKEAPSITNEDLMFDPYKGLDV